MTPPTMLRPVVRPPAPTPPDLWRGATLPAGSGSLAAAWSCPLSSQRCSVLNAACEGPGVHVYCIRYYMRTRATCTTGGQGPLVLQADKGHLYGRQTGATCTTMNNYYYYYTRVTSLLLLLLLLLHNAAPCTARQY